MDLMQFRRVKITTLILLLICRLCSGVDPPVLGGKEADVKKGSKETGLRLLLALPPGGSHANRHGPNAQRTPPPRSGGLRDTAARGTFPGVKPTVTQTAVGRGTTKVTVNSRHNTHPDIEDIGEDLEEDLKNAKTYHENMQETIKTTPEVTSTAEPKEPLEYKMNMSLVTVGKSTDGTLSVVTYTAKPDANIPLLLHNDKLVWKGIDSMSNKDTLVKATVYLGSGGPLAANLTYKRVTESTTKEYCKLVKDRWTFVDKSSLERTFDEVGELPGNANASAYRIKVDSTLFDIQVGKHNGIPVLNCIAKKGVKVPKLVYDGKVVWQADGNQSCSSATFYFGKSGIIGISFTHNSIEETLHDCFRVFSNDKWEGVNGDYYEKVLHEAKNPETSVATASENTKSKSFIDTAKFTVVNDMEDRVPVLRCTAGNGASKLTYGSDTIWPGKKDVTCLSATVYLDNGHPKLALLVTRDKNNKQGTVYRYHDGKQWKNDNENTHKKNLDALKTKAKNHPIAKQSPVQLTPKQGVQAKPGDAPVKTDEQTPQKKPQVNAQPAPPTTSKLPTQPSKRAPVKETLLDIGRPDPQSYRSFDYALDDVPTRLIVTVKEQPNKVVLGQETVWSYDTGRCNYCTVHMKDNRPVLVYMSGRSFSLYILKTDGGWKSIDNYSEEFAKLRLAVPSPSTFSIDISTHQDTGQYRVFDTLFNKVNTRFYVPKAGRYATSVSNGQAVLWRGDKEKAIMVRVYSSDNPTLLHMLSKDTNGAFKHSYLVKGANTWESISKDVHDRLLSEIKATAPGKHTDVGRLRQELMESQASLDKLVESKKFTDRDGPEDPSILDIVHYEESNAYTVTDCTLDGYPTTVFIPEKGSINKVVYGTLTIWEGTEKEECRYLMFHDKPGKNPFITLFVDYMDESKFMVYEMRDKWTFSHQLLGPKNDHKTTVSTVFNLSDKTHQNVYFCDNVFNGIVHRAFSPLPGYHVQEVKDTETTIWQAEDKEQCIFILSVPGTDKSKVPLLSLFVRNEDHSGFKHFEKTDKWRHIDERGYDKRLIEKKQTNNVTTAVAIATIPQYKNAVTLDTVNVDHDRVDLHEDSLNGTRCLYSAKANDYFNGLSDNSKSVWKSDKDKCLTVAMYGKDELHCRLDVLSSDVITPMYFCRKAGNWSSTNYNTFHEWLRSYVKTPRVKLDLDNLDTNFFESFRYTQNGYEILYGRPLPGYVLTTVADGSTEVWEAGHNQYATEFQMSIIGDYTLLSIINHSYQVENICFLKSSNSWSPIDEDVYDQYLVPVNESTISYLKFDLSKPDFSIVVGHKDVMGDITVLKYTPHLGRHVTAVFFGESTIWSGHYHDEYCISSEHITKGGALFIRLLLKMGSSFEHRYFTKVEGRWVTLKEDEFKNKLGIQSVNMNAKSILGDESDPNVYTLDISGTVDGDKILVTETIYEEVKSVTYLPKFTAGIGKVVDSDSIIWMGASDQKCVTAVISSKEGHDSLVSISINVDIEVQYKYLVKKDKEWYIIRKTKYDELLATMYRQFVVHADTTFDNPMTLDISKKPTEDITFYEYTHNEVTYKTFKPKDDKSIVEVMDGKSVLWKSSSGKCIDAWTYSTPLSSLCRLDILSSGIITPHCFEKKGSVWISLDFKLYTEKLKKLLSYKSINVMIEASGVSRDIGTVVEYFDKHAISTTIVPKFNIAKINYNKDMWESHGKQCINAHFITSPGGDLAYINAKSSNGDISPSSFYYSSGKWHEGNHYNFTNDHSKLPPLPKDVFNGKLVDTTLDINSVGNAIRIYNYSDKTITRVEYQTPMNANVKRIVDGAKMPIWQGTDNERCLSCEVYSREGHPPVMKLIIKNHYGLNIYYFERVDNEWNEINRNIFNLRLASLSNNSRLQLLKDRLLDASGNSDVFERKTSYTSEEINMLYLNQWLLSHVPHWVLDQFNTLCQKKNRFSR